jgi:hypothetical protein
MHLALQRFPSSAVAWVAILVIFECVLLAFQDSFLAWFGFSPQLSAPAVTARPTLQPVSPHRQLS